MHYHIPPFILSLWHAHRRNRYSCHIVPMKYRRKILRNPKKLAGFPRNGWWSRMIHKWWIRDLEDKKRPLDNE